MLKFESIILFCFVVHQCTSDFYNILGITKESNDNEIKKSYRRLALELHPDKIPSNASEEMKKIALDNFLAIKEAYETLIDPEKRMQYDSGQHDSSTYTSIKDMEYDKYTSYPFSTFIKTKRIKLVFNAMFQPPPIPPIIINLYVELSKVMTGTVIYHTFFRRILCPVCHGNGGHEGECRICTLCKGKGISTHLFSYKSSYQQMTESSCKSCGGRGCVPQGACDRCRGRGMILKQEDLTITLPMAFNHGEQMHFHEFGHQTRDGRVGSVSLQVWYELPSGWVADSLFNLHHQVDAPVADMLTGFQRNITSATGENITVVCPAHYNMENITDHGVLVQLPGKGLFNREGGRGNLTITIKPQWDALQQTSLLNLLELSGMSTKDPKYNILRRLLSRSRLETVGNLDADMSEGKDDMSGQFEGEAEREFSSENSRRDVANKMSSFEVQPCDISLVDNR